MSDEKAENMYQVHHIFVDAISRAADDTTKAAKLVLDKIGFNIESQANKVALFIKAAHVDAIKGASETVKNIYRDTGFGMNSHFGSHPGYNAFVIQKLRDATELNNLEAKKLAVYDLH